MVYYLGFTTLCKHPKNMPFRITTTPCKHDISFCRQKTEESRKRTRKLLWSVSFILRTYWNRFRRFLVNTTWGQHSEATQTFWEISAESSPTHGRTWPRTVYLIPSNCDPKYKGEISCLVKIRRETHWKAVFGGETMKLGIVDHV